MMSANAVINNILVQSSDYIKDKHFEDLKMVLYMNLCNITFVQNDASNELIENSDITFGVLRNWRDQLIVEGKTAGTITQYMFAMRKLIEFTGLGVAEIRENHIRSYLAHGKVYRKWKDKTYNGKVRCLRQFFNWATDYDIIAENPMRRIKETKEDFRIGSILTPEQREIFRCCCRTERELSLVDFLYSTGGRVSEIRQLNRNQIDLVNRRAVIYGKGRKEREIYFSPQAFVHVTQYLAGRKDDNEALFVSTKKPYNRLTKDGIRWIIKDIQSRDDRLKGLQISPHTFRRTCGTDMINHGAPAELVQRKLGHSNINTTLTCYAQIATETVREANNKYCYA